MHGKMDTVDQEKTTEINQLTDCELQPSGRKNHRGSLTAQVNHGSGVAFLAEEPKGIS